MADVLLIRHGQSANNASAENERVPDPGLTEIGGQQATATAKWLESYRVDFLYCSPFLRALETARPIAEAKGLRPHVIAELCEQGGCYSGHEPGQKVGVPGMNRKQLEQHVPGWEIESAIGAEGWWNRDFESQAAVELRAKRIVGWMQNTFDKPEGVYVLVIHADFKRRLLEQLLPVPAMAGEVLGPLRNAGVTHLTWDNDRWTLQSMNSTGHLRQSLVTG